MNYTIQELLEYNEKIEKLVDEIGLDCYKQEFEIISFEDMLCYEAYVGMPSHYPHWSFGKSYEKTKTLYSYNLTGLPYEMVINSNPCIAYLMKDNTLLLQVLTIAHVYGHNDFFNNNRLFKEYTRAELTVEMFKNHANRVREYIQDPSIGYDEVEKIIDAAHAIKFNCGAGSSVRHDEHKKIEYPYENLQEFLCLYGDLEEWQKDVLTIVMEESRYFVPQMETKIMNEGWASFWHYQILNRLGLSQGMQMEFLGIHNNVISPHSGSLNPYYIGFKIWEDLYKKYDGDFKKLSLIREVDRDASFIRNYLTYDICSECNLFEFEEAERYYVVSEVANSEGWRNIRNTLAQSVGIGTIPVIEVEDVLKGENTLILNHVWDGRELNLSYATETLKHIQTLWGGKVVLKTNFAKVPRKIVCNKNKKVLIENE
ncbi:MAG: SpoVR family protein [Cellulosilyticaceae bacterium]